jgi:hypothetical protein
MMFVIGISLKAIKSSETSLDKLTMSDLGLSFLAFSLLRIFLSRHEGLVRSLSLGTVISSTSSKPRSW